MCKIRFVAAITQDLQTAQVFIFTGHQMLHQASIQNLLFHLKLVSPSDGGIDHSKASFAELSAQFVELAVGYNVC